MKTQKENYESLALEVLEINLEQGIAITNIGAPDMFEGGDMFPTI